MNHHPKGLTDLMDVLKNLFEKQFHIPVERVQPVQGELGGSGRKIIRLSGGGKNAIGILYGVREENAAFLEFSRHFRKHGLPVPEIYGEDLDHGAYLEEDLGDTSLFEFLSKNRQGEKIAPPVVEAYRQTISILPRFQVEASRDLKTWQDRNGFGGKLRQPGERSSRLADSSTIQTTKSRRDLCSR